jgi:hypothetical protein
MLCATASSAATGCPSRAVEENLHSSPKLPREISDTLRVGQIEHVGLNHEALSARLDHLLSHEAMCREVSTESRHVAATTKRCRRPRTRFDRLSRSIVHVFTVVRCIPGCQTVPDQLRRETRGNFLIDESGIKGESQYK